MRLAQGEPRRRQLAGNEHRLRVDVVRGDAEVALIIPGDDHAACPVRNSAAGVVQELAPGGQGQRGAVRQPAGIDSERRGSPHALGEHVEAAGGVVARIAPGEHCTARAVAHHVRHEIRPVAARGADEEAVRRAIHDSRGRHVLRKGTGTPESSESILFPPRRDRPARSVGEDRGRGLTAGGPAKRDTVWIPARCHRARGRQALGVDVIARGRDVAPVRPGHETAPGPVRNDGIALTIRGTRNPDCRVARTIQEPARAPGQGTGLPASGPEQRSGRGNALGVDVPSRWEIAGVSPRDDRPAGVIGADDGEGLVRREGGARP